MKAFDGVHNASVFKIVNKNLIREKSPTEKSPIGEKHTRRLPSHPHPPKLKEVPTVLPQVTGVPVHLPSFQTGHSPTGLYNTCKKGKIQWISPLPL